MAYLESDRSVALIARPARYNESAFSQEIQATPEALPIAPVSFPFTPGQPIRAEAEMTYPDRRTFTVSLDLPGDALVNEADVVLALASPGAWPAPALYFDPGTNLLALRLDVSTGETLAAPAIVGVELQDLAAGTDPVALHRLTGSGWVELASSIVDGWLVFDAPQGSTVAFQTNRFQESKAARRMGQIFPIWTKMHRDRASTGRLFLNGPGLALDEAKGSLDQMLSSLFLETLDASQIHQADAALLPKDAAINLPYRIYAGDLPLPIIGRLQDFYQATEPAGYVEPESRSVYLRNAPGKIAFSQRGRIAWLERAVHPVWNDFDEFGLLLGLPRIPGETNERYRATLRTVGWVLPGSSREWLLADWARRLGLLTELSWEDDREPLEIPGAIPYACFVDGMLYPAAETTSGARLDPPEDATGASHEVAALLQIVSAPLFARENDPWLHERLFDAWGRGTSSYRSLVDEIGRAVPVLWGEIRVGEALWEAGKAVSGGFGFIPSHMDPHTVKEGA